MATELRYNLWDYNYQNYAISIYASLFLPDYEQM